MTLAPSGPAGPAPTVRVLPTPFDPPPASATMATPSCCCCCCCCCCLATAVGTTALVGGAAHGVAVREGQPVDWPVALGLGAVPTGLVTVMLLSDVGLAWAGAVVAVAMAAMAVRLAGGSALEAAGVVAVTAGLGLLAFVAEAGLVLVTFGAIELLALAAPRVGWRLGRRLWGP